MGVMAFSNSKLVDYTLLSPNHSGKRIHSIDRITPHCVVGQLTCEGIAACFPKGREASANYGIGYDGRRSLIVEEKNRSWCSSSADNDHRAVTIEVASDKTHPYAFTNEAYKSLVELCVDICERNGLNKVLWFNDKNTAIKYNPRSGECVLTVHRWFANKACPGDWMFNRMGQLATDINKLLSGASFFPIDTNQDCEVKTYYRVQFGAFGKKQNAESYLAKVKQKGIDAFIIQVGALYKVQVGSFSVKSNAENYLDKMKKLGFECIISPVSISSQSFTPRAY